MTWISLDCHLPDHSKIVELPSDTARWGWVVVLTKAKLQRQAGRFASAKHFAHVVRPYGRFLNAYLSAGLIERDGDQLVIHDWRKHQWAASKARLREDGDENDGGDSADIERTESGHKVDASRAVPVPVLSVSKTTVERARAEGGADALDSWYRLTGSWPSPKILPWLNELIEEHGDSAVSNALGEEWIVDPSRATILGRVRDRLEREAHEATKRREEAKRKAAEEERQRIESMPPEQREANMKRLREMLAEKGLVQ